jgi:ankyrin repeat protein
MQQMLSQRPSLNDTDENGMTPLHVAIDSRRATCVGLLIEAGADRGVRDRQGRTPFDAADRIDDLRDRTKIFLLLTRNSSANQLHTQAKGPAPWSLEYSVMHRQSNVTKMLLSMGADPNVVDSGGTTPLAKAALKGDLDSVRALLAHGARPNGVGPTDTLPIHDAARGDSAEVIRELVKHGADINARTREESQTPLYIAAAMGKMRAVEALVALGADLAGKDSSGRTPLEAAERAGLDDVAAFLRRAAAEAK